MKRVKDLLLSLFIFGSIVVIIFIIISFFNTKQSITVSRNDTIEEKLDNLKQMVNSFEDNDCKEYLDFFISYIDKLPVEGKIKLRDLYDYFNNYPTIRLYEGVQNKCHITEEEIKEYGINGKYATVMALSNDIFNKYMFSYELNLKDEQRLLTESNTDSLNYTSIRFNQVEILNDYVTLVELKEVTNE